MNTTLETKLKQVDDFEAQKGTVKHLDNGQIIAKDRKTGLEITAKEIDHKYFQETGEIMVIEWELA